MPVVDVYNLDNKKVGTVDLDAEIFDVEVREHLFHEMVTSQLASRRSGTANTRERSEVHGANTKAWRQKGTGRARQGSRKAPHWVGGGTVFGPKPRTFAKKVNKNTRRSALKAALSARQQEGRLVVLENFELDEIKTRRVVQVLSQLEGSKHLIVDVDNANLSKSANNLADSAYMATAGLNVYDILRHDSLVITRDAVDAIARRLGQ
ncbi:MAG: 50S ribosomal protein L4 [Myxococcota bacterium]|nr:50S ribosomal protein L4 [Myxococcota bacterium]